MGGDDSLNKKGNILVSVLVYLVFILLIVFIMFDKLVITKNEFVNLQKNEKARINAINASNLAKAYISNYADIVLGLLRAAGYSSHQSSPPSDIKETGNQIINEIMQKVEKKNREIVELFKDESREDPYDWLWVIHRNFSNPSDPLNSRVNLIEITKDSQSYDISDVLAEEGVLDIFVIFAKGNKNIALLLSRSKISNKDFIVYSLVGKDTLAKYGTFLNSWPESGYWTDNYIFDGDLRLNVEPNVRGHPKVLGDYYAPDKDEDGYNWRHGGDPENNRFIISGENYYIGGDELSKYNLDNIKKHYGNTLEYGTKEPKQSNEGNSEALVIDIAKMKGSADYKKWVDNLYKLLKPDGYMKGLWIRNKIVRILIPEKVKIDGNDLEINFPINVLADVDDDGTNERVKLAIAVGETESSHFTPNDEIVVAFKATGNSADITLKFLAKDVSTNFKESNGGISKKYTGHFVYFDSSTNVWKMLESPIATVVSGETWPEILDPSTVVVRNVRLVDEAQLDPTKELYKIFDARDQDSRTSPYWKTLRIYGKDEINRKEGYVFETFPFEFNGIIDLDNHEVILGDVDGSINQDLCLVDGKYTVYTKSNIYQISSIIYQDYAKKVQEHFNISSLLDAAQIIDNYPFPYYTYQLNDMVSFLRNNSSNVDDFLNLVCEGKYYAIGNTSWWNNFKSLDIERNADMKLFGAIYAIGKNSELTSNYEDMNMHSTFWIYGSAVLQTEGITEQSWGRWSKGYSIHYAHDWRIKKGIAAWNYGTPGAPSEIQVYGTGVLEE